MTVSEMFHREAYVHDVSGNDTDHMTMMKSAAGWVG